MQSIWCAPAQEVLKEYTQDLFSYEELLQDPLPKGVNPSKLEEYLSDIEFVRIFGMKKIEFIKLPQWKKDNLKRDVYLY